MLPTSVRILVCTQRQDMRRSFDTLAAVVRDVMREDPQSGSLYVFVGRHDEHTPPMVLVGGLWHEGGLGRAGSAAVTASGKDAARGPVDQQLRRAVQALGRRRLDAGAQQPLGVRPQLSHRHAVGLHG